MSLTNLDVGSGQYGVDEGGITNVVSRMEDAISTLRNSINQIDQSVQAVARGWQGDAHREFKGAAASWHDEVGDLNKKFDLFSGAVKSGKDAIVGADSEGLA